METLLGRPLEVEVRDSVDKALKILKQKMSKEGILQEIKRRRYYEKPSVKRKRKMREARKRRRREAKRRALLQMLDRLPIRTERNQATKPTGNLTPDVPLARPVPGTQSRIQK